MASNLRRGLASISGGAALTVLVSLVGIVPAATSAPGGKVTICHRTHSVTNPYRMITVNASAADGRGGGDHTGHNRSYEFEGTVYPIFDPSVTYPPNQKHWGDIIPPVRSSDGLNWTMPGAHEIYTGTDWAFGLCVRMSAKQFFDVEVAALPADLTPEERSDALREILADLDEQGAIDDTAMKDQLGIDNFADLDPEALPNGFTNAPTRPRGPRPPAGFGPQPGQQKLAVVVWWDTDGDGEFDDVELPAEGIVVSIQPVLSEALATTLSPATSQVETDERGRVIIDSLDAGQWDVTVIAPDGSVVTWDSEGTTDDGSAQVDVPADSAGFAWVGLTLVDGTTGDEDEELTGDAVPLAATGTSNTAPLLIGLSALLVALGAALLRTRTRSSRRNGAQ